MIFPPPPSAFLPLSAPLDGHFLGALLAPLLRPKYRLIVFEAEISLGWGRRVADGRAGRGGGEDRGLPSMMVSAMMMMMIGRNSEEHLVVLTFALGTFALSNVSQGSRILIKILSAQSRVNCHFDETGPGERVP